MGQPTLSINYTRLLIQGIAAFIVGFFLHHLLLESWIHTNLQPGLLQYLFDIFSSILFTAPFFYIAVYRDFKKKAIKDQYILDQYEKFRTILEGSTVGAFIYDEDGFVYVSPKFCRKLGYRSKDFIGKTFSEIPLLTKETQELVTRNVKSRMSGIPVQDLYVVEAKKKDQTKVFLEVRANASPYRNRRMIIGSVIDVTDRLKLETSLRQSEHMYRQLFESNMDAVMLIDKNGIVIEANPMTEVNSGFAREELVGKPFPEIIHSDDLARIVKEFEKVVLGESIQTECRSIHKTGEEKFYHINAFPFYENGHITGGFCLCRDITNEKKQEKTIQRLAYHDFLTGLPNRHYFTKEFKFILSMAAREDQNVALLYMDLDRVKAVNDNLGHTAGDELLKEVTKRFEQACEGKGVIARIGGDEFTVLLPFYESLTQVTDLANDILISLSEPVHIGNHPIHAKTSVGISLYPHHGDNMEKLIQAADIAMFQAKHLGGNQYQFFDSSNNNKSEEYFHLEHDLIKAVKNDEFFLEYQPKMDGKTLEIRATEALIRWNHPKKGLISPSEFIPLAEETGLIVQIGEWVLREACIQVKEWERKGYPNVRMAVNVSAVQFRQVDMATLIENILKEFSLKPSSLEIEITEGTLIEDNDFITSGIKRLKKLGVYNSLDDFGTGYSSMNYLKQFRLHSLKIDKSFVSNVDQQPELASIVKAIVQLAHGLGMQVVAEGVETENELQFLRNERIDEVQGFILSGPLPASGMEQLFIENKKIG